MMLAIDAALYSSEGLMRRCKLSVAAAEVLRREATVESVAVGLSGAGRAAKFRIRGDERWTERGSLSAFQARVAADVLIDGKSELELDVLMSGGAGSKPPKPPRRALAETQPEQLSPIARLRMAARPPRQGPRRARSVSVRPQTRTLDEFAENTPRSGAGRPTASSARKRATRRGADVTPFEATTRTPKTPRTTAQNAPLYGDEIHAHKKHLGGGASASMAERRMARMTISSLEARLLRADEKIKKLEEQKEKVVVVTKEIVVHGGGTPRAGAPAETAPTKGPATLEELEECLKAATRRLLVDGDESASADCEKYQQLVAAHPQYQARLREERAAWEREQLAANLAARDDARRLVPPDVSACSAADLERRGAPKTLAKRLVTRKALWLVRLPPDRVAKTHVVVLRGTYDVAGLDLFELRAVYASLPDAFENDANGDKAAWRENVRDKLVSAIRDNRPRNPAYRDLPDGLDLAQYEDLAAPVAASSDPPAETPVRSGVDSSADNIRDELQALRGAGLKAAAFFGAAAAKNKKPTARTRSVPPQPLQPQASSVRAPPPPPAGLLAELRSVLNRPKCEQ